MSLVIFDLDDTIVKGQSQFHLAKYYLQNKGISRIEYFKILLWFLFYKIGIIKNVRPAMENFFATLKNKSVEEMNSLMEKFYAESLSDKIIEQVRNKITEHVDKGDEVVIMSNAMEPLVKVIANNFGIHKFYATKLEIINDKYTGKISGDIMYSRNKLQTIKNEYSDEELKESYAYADHYSDIELLSKVGHPIAVSPDKRLRVFAKINNWEII